MGAKHSVEAPVPTAEPSRPAMRNKLTKPRTNSVVSRGRPTVSPRWSISSSSKTHPFDGTAGHRYSLDERLLAGGKLRQLRDSVAPWVRRTKSHDVPTISVSNIDADDLPEAETRTDGGRDSESVPVSPCTTLKRSDSGFAHSDYSPPVSALVRRKSQLRAAPPATATRRPQRPQLPPQRRHTVHAGEWSGSGSCLPLYELSEESERCITPSGYSVIGAFKRGSLRITNGAPSPVPSTVSGYPESNWKPNAHEPVSFGHADAAGYSTPDGRRSVSLNSASLHAVSQRIRLVTPSLPPSPSDSVEHISSPGSMFSFVESPVCDKGAFDSPPRSVRNSPRPHSEVIFPPRNHATVLELPAAEELAMQAAVPDEYSQNVVLDAATKAHRETMRMHRHTKSSTTTDSGYSSAGSTAASPSSPSSSENTPDLGPRTPARGHRKEPVSTRPSPPPPQERQEQPRVRPARYHYRKPTTTTSSSSPPPKSAEQTAYGVFPAEDYRALIEPETRALYGIRSGESLRASPPPPPPPPSSSSQSSHAAHRVSLHSGNHTAYHAHAVHHAHAHAGYHVGYHAHIHAHHTALRENRRMLEVGSRHYLRSEGKAYHQRVSQRHSLRKQQSLPSTNDRWI